MSFTARYPGTCDACEGSINPGEEIQDSTEGQRAWQPYEHVKCPTSLVVPQTEACKKCFLIHNGECF